MSPLAGLRFLDLSNTPLTDISLVDSFPLLEELSVLGTGLSCDLPILASLAARLRVFNSDCPNL